MGIKKYLDNKGKVLFCVTVNLRSQRNRSLRKKKQTKGLPSYEEALKEEKRLRKIAQSLLVEKEIQGATLGVIINKWEAHIRSTKVRSGDIGEKYLIDASGTLRKWLAPYLGQLASNMTAYRLNEVVRFMRSEGIGLSQLQKFRRWIEEIFNFAIHVDALPAGIEIPKIELRFKSSESAPEILSHQNILRFMKTAIDTNHPWKDVWGVALLTGMRSGELYALEWRDVNFEDKIIRVSRSHKSLTKEIKSTKAGYWRDVPLSSELTTILLKLKKQNPSDIFVLPRLQQWSSGQQASILRKFCAKNNLPSIKFHTLRACFATQLLKNGVEAAKVMKVCGWKDLSTMQHYVRLAGIEVSGVTDKISVYPSESLNVSQEKS